MSLESLNSTPPNTLENEQRFVLGTKEGLQKFQEFIVAEEGQIDALDPSLTIEDLALPDNVAERLQQLRLAYTQLVQLTNKGLQTEGDELSENTIVSIADQYKTYIAADEKFSTAYVAYEDAFKNQQLKKNEADTAAPEVSWSASADTQSTKEREHPENPAPEKTEVDIVEQSQEDEPESTELFGLSLPQAGAQGVLTTRSFRDGFEIVKRTHPDIKDNPENLTIADSIIRLLFVVPATGLTEEKVTKVTQLIQKLNVSGVGVAPGISTVSEAENLATESEEIASGENETDIAKQESAELTNSELEEFDDWTPRIKSGAMQIEVDTEDDGDVKILFARKVADKAEKDISSLDDSVVGAINALTHSREGSSVVAKMEEVDSINNSIPAEVARDAVKREMASKNSLTGTYLASHPELQAVFQEKNISSATFEKKVQKTIASIDAKEIDFWEAKFDEPYQSTFSFLKKMTLQEIEDFNDLPLSERKDILQAENIKYEAYVAWMDTYESIAQTDALVSATTFAELFVEEMIETELADD